MFVRKQENMFLVNFRMNLRKMHFRTPRTSNGLTGLLLSVKASGPYTKIQTIQKKIFKHFVIIHDLCHFPPYKFPIRKIMQPDLFKPSYKLLLFLVLDQIQDLVLYTCYFVVVYIGDAPLTLSAFNNKQTQMKPSPSGSRV